ncbi:MULTISPECIES: histidine--tRNA ligase [unclassified Oceanispirochaeta]|uniref:histidine--tRNA ligase n=1 Tax=unclassified Oceanispirochaeta TaxID=2635722 RepID=UPI000E08ECB7|nr:MULTISPECIES: histidine--tRNA ligase [unclassified Oceanispirochaeta]MBF9016489.1 histidine--tRNA ligase [Oceanispirochaeta sp. M2]NPD72951.1 histidine--tRNA ligase [Oceanispirochaeta sp. M1]RDG31525.1 histidine--tRNA ligase [Oceanispirochaeta sp. M1]
MSKIIEPKILKGFRDSLPATEIERKRVIRLLEDNFEGYGFVPIDTPVLEYTEVLLGKGSGETDKQMYRFLDNGKRDVAMRFDLTIPFARFMAKNRSDLYLPFKRYHINKVWRGENTQKGRYREFTQCDFDIVGTDCASADFEILMMMRRSLKVLDIPSCTIHMNHRGIFNRFLDLLGLREQSEEVLRTVDKLAKIGRDEVMRILTELSSGESAEKILDFIKKEESFTATLNKMENLAGGPDDDTQRLKEIYSYIQELGLEDAFELNPSITRGLDYYTGIVYETFLDELPGIGSVCSGGRYNNLAELYTKESLPGVGSSIGLDRLMAGLAELGHTNDKNSNTGVLILNMDPTLVGYYHSLAEDFREAGINCEVYHESKKFGPQFKFAEAKGIPLAIICGSNEKEAGTVNLKNLNTRESFEGLSPKDAIQKAGEIID